jgi:addiction module HigA family antidote
MIPRPVHPGEILREELELLGVTPTELARQLKIPANRITQIVQGKRAIAGDTALRLAHWFRYPPKFWLNLQMEYELYLAEKISGEEIAKLPKFSCSLQSVADRSVG